MVADSVFSAFVTLLSFTNLYLMQVGMVLGFVVVLVFCFEVVPVLCGYGSFFGSQFSDFVRYQILMSAFSVAVGALYLAAFYGLGFREAFFDITHLSIASQVLILLFVSECFIYMFHRAAHVYRIPILSRAHRFHHTITTELDWVNGRKEHPVVISLFMLVYCVLFFLVFASASLAHSITLALYIFLNALSHFRIPFSIPYLDYVFLFPKDHRRHHTARGGPYGVTLSLFDTLFDTRV